MFYSRSNPVFEVRIGLWGGFKSLKDAGSENLLEWSYSISGTGGANLRRAFSINFDPEAEAVRPETGAENLDQRLGIVRRPPLTRITRNSFITYKPQFTSPRERRPRNSRPEWIEAYVST